MADVEMDVSTGQPKKRTLKKFRFRGVDLDVLLDMSTDELVGLFTGRGRRRFQRGLTRKPMALNNKLRKAKREAPAGEKPNLVKTHLHNMIIVPEMIGSVIGVLDLVQARQAWETRYPSPPSPTMADVEMDVAAGQPKKRTFKKFRFRGVDLDVLVDMSTDELVKLFTGRGRRRFQRGLTRKPMALNNKLRKAKREAPAGEKPNLVKTHLHNMIIVPEMIGSVIGGVQRQDIQPNVEMDVAAGQPKKRTFKKFRFRGVDLDVLLDMSTDELVKLFTARPHKRFQRGLTGKRMALNNKLRKAKREAPAGEKPNLVKTHLHNMIIVPEMIGSVIGVYIGKTFNQVEIKPEMIGHYLAEFSISYKPVKHGRPSIGATHSSRFIPLRDALGKHTSTDFDSSSVATDKAKGMQHQLSFCYWKDGMEEDHGNLVSFVTDGAWIASVYYMSCFLNFCNGSLSKIIGAGMGY
ncbi:hypothetical protein RHSIM_RhsimUnG0114600 [Rhododendron simsii]|uniref:40S ribosomal protein S15 n=1 Tax=Rhododendron simsii TaxID=118357 RepID=A0A834L4U7_RHOSS|nr:hypothetical protein RHSIM_RhsimUnG0114600 [Rhododendron simsii]